MVRLCAHDEILGHKAVSSAGCSTANPPNVFGFDATIVHDSSRVNLGGFSSCIRCHFRLSSALPSLTLDPPEGRVKLRAATCVDTNALRESELRFASKSTAMLEKTPSRRSGGDLPRCAGEVTRIATQAKPRLKSCTIPSPCHTLTARGRSW